MAASYQIKITCFVRQVPCIASMEGHVWCLLRQPGFFRHHFRRITPQDTVRVRHGSGKLPLKDLPFPMPAISLPI